MLEYAHNLQIITSVAEILSQKIFDTTAKMFLKDLALKIHTSVLTVVVKISARGEDYSTHNFQCGWTIWVPVHVMAEHEVLYGIPLPSVDGSSYYNYHLVRKVVTRWLGYS
jgi:hypothetical protein